MRFAIMNAVIFPKHPLVNVKSSDDDVDVLGGMARALRYGHVLFCRTALGWKPVGMVHEREVTTRWARGALVHGGGREIRLWSVKTYHAIVSYIWWAEKAGDRHVYMLAIYVKIAAYIIVYCH